MSDNSTPVVATKLINGTIQPGTIFAPADHEIEAEELHRLQAVTEATPADIALYEAQKAAGSKAPVKAANKSVSETVSDAVKEAVAKVEEATGTDLNDDGLVG